MKVTIENWMGAERDLKEFGVQEVFFDEKGLLQTLCKIVPATIDREAQSCTCHRALLQHRS